VPLALKFSDPNLAIHRRPGRWRGCSAEHVVLPPTDKGVSFDLTGETHYLALHDIQLRDGETVIDGLEANHTRDLRDTITFVPKGRHGMGWLLPEARTNSFTALHFDPELIHEELATRYAKAAPGPAVYQRNRGLQATLLKLKNLLSQPSVDDLQAESLSLLAALEVFNIATEPVSGRLSERQLRDVHDYLRANLNREVSLSGLARAARLSRFHFSRAFKNATGSAPHRYVARLRIEAAARMLVDTDSPIEVIACCCGFSGGAHFRRAFQSEMGCSPLAYRRQTL
jgi:AraC family transcriptional regulator